MVVEVLEGLKKLSARMMAYAPVEDRAQERVQGLGVVEGSVVRVKWVTIRTSFSIVLRPAGLKRLRSVPSVPRYSASS